MRLKELEILVSQVTARLESAESQNSTLRNRVRTLEAQIDRLRQSEEELRDLREWKKATTAEIKKVLNKVEKELKGS
ncbi:hypothetical protein Dip518_001000 [Parelusimicrobium proximum]|uniref:hypothetical protein n=1 Tax=Parelusimicrobium proximum TaxID=3228953 RepID=UPI003D181434